MLDVQAYLKKLTEACDRYERSAPTVCAHCDDLYRRISECPEKVSLAELIEVSVLWSEGWLHPNFAANRIYHTRHRLGMDTTGHIGF